MPGAKSAGILAGPGQAVAQAEWLAMAKGAGLNLVPLVANNSSELFAVLQSALTDLDALVLLPDPAVINRSTVQNLLLTTYRQRVPVVGYSHALVDAGALLAVYSTPEQIAQEAVETILRMVPGRGWALPPPVYPKYFTVKSNASVGRALDVAVPGDAVLLQRLNGGGS